MAGDENSKKIDLLFAKYDALVQKMSEHDKEDAKEFAIMRTKQDVFQVELGKASDELRIQSKDISMNAEASSEEIHKLEVELTKNIITCKSDSIKESKEYTNWGVGIAIGVVVFIGVIIEIIINVVKLGGH